MISAFLSQISNYFNKRFVVTCLFPSFFVGGVSLLIYWWLRGFRLALEDWPSKLSTTQILISLSFLVVNLIVAYFLETFNQSIVRFFEGYWEHTPLYPMRSSRREFYVRRFDDLINKMGLVEQKLTKLDFNVRTMQKRQLSPHEEKCRDRLRAVESRLKQLSFYFFPENRELIMPTQLGNILRSAELYSLKRYRIDAVLVWSRLGPLLPSDFSRSLDDARGRLNLLLNLALLSGVFTMIWTVIIIGFFPFAWIQFIVVNILGILGIWLGYRGALQSAILYGDHIRSAFDLYRGNLLDALNLKKPASYEEECVLWHQVNNLIYRGIRHEIFAYGGSASSTEKQPEKSETRSWLQIVFEFLSLRKNDREISNDVSVDPEVSSLNDENTDTLHRPSLVQENNNLDSADLGSQLLPDKQIRYFSVGFITMILFATFTLFCRARAPQPVPVFNTPASAYTRIANTSYISVPTYKVTEDVVLDQNVLQSRYTLVPVDAQVPVKEGQLGPPIPCHMISDTLPLAINVSYNAIFGGRLKRGQVVDLWNHGTRVLTGTILLDIQPMKNENYQIVILVPQSMYTQTSAIEKPSWNLTFNWCRMR